MAARIVTNVFRWFYWTLLLAYLVAIAPIVVAYALLFDDDTPEEWKV
jgi:hypothetical protein